MQLVSRTTRRATRRFLTTVSAAVRSVVAPSTLVEQTATETPAPAADPADVYTEADMPPVEDIERAAKEYDKAADMRRRADRASRAAKKLITRVPSGIYNGWKISRKPSARQVIDANAVAATYKKLGLGPVPLKPCADSLVVERVELGVPADIATAELVAA